jgi:arsenical pump membrane protein
VPYPQTKSTCGQDGSVRDQPAASRVCDRARRRFAGVAIANVAVWSICAVSIAGVLTRPKGIGEWIWALAGALLLALFGLVPLPEVLAAVGKGTDVYLFLAGMMLLAELARREGVFDWVASHAVRAAKSSRVRLFALVYGVGIVVTTVLSNDATAVVLTPAVAAAVRKAKAEPLPYLFACAFIANAASFVLPISNPANLVVFAHDMPALPRWLQTFAIPSLISIAVTFVALAFVSRRALRGAVTSEVPQQKLERGGRLALGGIGATAVALIAASAFGAPLGLVTCICGVLVVLTACIRDREALLGVARSVSWSVLLLVAGLFVLVQGLERTGLLQFTKHLSVALAAWPAPLAVLGAACVTSIASNLMNNLPAGLIAGASVASLHGHDAFRSAVAIGIDLGPNLSVTGSLATVLWLIALRREQIAINAWTFLGAGVVVMPAALILAVESLLITSR